AATTLLTKEMAAELMGASGQQGAALLRRLFSLSRFSVQELLKADAAALAASQSGGVRYLGMAADRIPGFFGYQSRAFATGYGASFLGLSVSALGNGAADWWKGKTYPDGSPVTPLSVLADRCRFTPYDRAGNFDPFVVVDSIWYQSLVMAPFVGY